MIPSRAFRRIAAATAVVALVFIAGASTVLVIVRLRERAPQSSQRLTVAVERQQPSGDAIVSEAATWRNTPTSFASDPESNRLPRAHPRTLATWRMRRAFPGGPPRIPHALTPREAMTSACNTCHERGGYSQRFGAHAPVTPHPQLEPCTQCHVTDAAIIGIDLPGVSAKPDAACRQCHFPVGAPARSVAGDVQTSTWPTIPKSLGDAPPVIPHDLQLRGNCQACHVGPGAVREIATTHPERSYCRQCHVAGVS